MSPPILKSNMTLPGFDPCSSFHTGRSRYRMRESKRWWESDGRIRRLCQPRAASQTRCQPGLIPNLLIPLGTAKTPELSLVQIKPHLIWLQKCLRYFPDCRNQSHTVTQHDDDHDVHAHFGDQHLALSSQFLRENIKCWNHEYFQTNFEFKDLSLQKDSV